MFDYLKRNIDTSTKYDKYFKKSNCEIEPLGYGTTDLTLKLMRGRTFKYEYQTKKLASTIPNNISLAKKTKKIQDFLYNYLQYEADGYEQMLKSPNCAYTDRLNGLDCKSYSLFGGSILLNKNIVFYYRKVKQANLKPNKYSHVYIVIPKNQKTYNLKDGYYVIDGTKREQNEVIYTKKKDILIMKDKFPHYGLNGATEVETKRFVQNFDVLLTNLQRKGANPNILLNFKNAVNHYLSKGESAEFTPIQNGIMVGKIVVSFSTGLNGESQEGGEDDYAWIADVWNWIQGLDFKCWGRQAVKEERMKSIINYMSSYIIERINILKSNTTTTQEKTIALNEYIKIAYIIYNVAEQKRTRGYRSCSDGRIKKVSEAAQQYISKLAKVKITLSFKYNVIELSTSPSNTNIQQYQSQLLNEEFGGDNRTITIPKFNLVKLTVTNPTNPTNPNTGSDNQGEKDKKNNMLPIGIGIYLLAKALL